ncbi:hypothetical protein L211DRAFT_651156 [Terfezia boudieri ATCC MYA-4762]|uniref:Uncharacterized protein n=1 Tax=Terfezia boudieri ATCC MYA-4762 TaxID=1051890 RepID=A0A3N4LV15_9PEZI|nr:hypothetical protein L211DRAFT_651156 [Terfezia boudieri ATCC MYA-4762]
MQREAAAKTLLAEDVRSLTGSLCRSRRHNRHYHSPNKNHPMSLSHRSVSGVSCTHPFWFRPEDVKTAVFSPVAPANPSIAQFTPIVNVLEHELGLLLQ